MERLWRAARAAPIFIALSGGAAAQTQISGNTFNPAISLILDGLFASYSADPAVYAFPGFALDEEAGLASEGLSLDETELAISANVDDKFYGFLTTALDQTGTETEVELEEAYFETLALPHGLKVKAGRFLSDIGYLNPVHPHAWDFVDAPLAYVAMLNGGYGDVGAQLRWVAPTELYVDIGGELLRGDSYPAAGAETSGGRGAESVSARVGGDVGDAHSWRAGIAYLTADANDRVSALDDGTLTFTGTSDVTILDFVWKWAKNGNPRDRSLVLLAEYLRREEDGSVTADTASNGIETSAYSGQQDGFYVQAVYQFRPRWRVGGRYDRLDASNELGLGTPTPLAAPGNPKRISAMVDFSNSEFSRLRLQVSSDDSRIESDDQIFVQYLMSLGAHGAHRF
jgi:hypothetical protein